MIPYIFDVSDVGIALVPLIVPFSLDSGGNLSSKGKRVNVLQGYYWGIPKSAKEKELAYLLVQYLNNRVVNTKEVVRSGSIPVREDVLMNMKNIYDERWLGEGYTAALNQIIDYFDDKDWLWDIKNDKFFVYDNYVYMRNVINSGAPYKTSEINKNTVRSLISRNFPLKDEK
jgi:ABC-type glycerol-3-phosphate transport system substrate-binding protein